MIDEKKTSGRLKNETMVGGQPNKVGWDTIVAYNICKDTKHLL